MSSDPRPAIAAEGYSYLFPPEEDAENRLFCTARNDYGSYVCEDEGLAVTRPGKPYDGEALCPFHSSHADVFTEDGYV